ncbi:hypothetical protein JQN58_20050 [Aneurinibacillus sp. BA2021]|nr:hypothetical protein [Aneurinibacillus sp. BA2021]
MMGSPGVIGVPGVIGFPGLIGSPGAIGSPGVIGFPGVIGCGPLVCSSLCPHATRLHASRRNVATIFLRIMNPLRT